MGEYEWDNIPDSEQFRRIPEGKQILQLFTILKGVNTNKKRFLMFKFCEPDNTIIINKYGNKASYPHATLQVFPEAKEDFGKKVLKHLLKNTFGEDRLNELNNDDAIIKAVDDEMPIVMGEVYYQDKYTNVKEFSFEEFAEGTEKINKTIEENRKNPEANMPNEDDELDLPF